MLQNAYLLAKIGADTAENEQQFAENLPKIGHHPRQTGSATRPTPRRASAHPDGKFKWPEITIFTKRSVEEYHGWKQNLQTIFRCSRLFVRILQCFGDFDNIDAKIPYAQEF